MGNMKSSRWYLTHAIIFWLIALIAGWYGIVKGQEPAFNLIWHEFDAFKGDAGEFHEIYIIGTVEIHAVSDRELFSHKPAQDDKNGYGGYTVYDIRKYPKKEIWILAKKVNGEVVFPWAVLGHEICHVLNFENKGVMNPDKRTGGD